MNYEIIVYNFSYKIVLLVRSHILVNNIYMKVLQLHFYKNIQHMLPFPPS